MGMLFDNATKKYIAAQHAINKTRQIVMLYDGAVTNINLAIEAIDKKDIQARFNAIDKVASIINGLQASLDFNNGGQIAKLLDDYYFSIYMRLMEVQRNNSKTMLENVKNELIVMREAWQEVDNKTNNEAIISNTLSVKMPKNNMIDEEPKPMDEIGLQFSV